jgi:hypothetical protein
MRSSFGFAFLLAALLISPTAALAVSTQCLCDNGKKMRTNSDAEDACQAACDLRGGGGSAMPDDDAKASDSDSDANSGSGSESAADDSAPSHRRVVASPPAAASPETENPNNRP